MATSGSTYEKDKGYVQSPERKKYYQREKKRWLDRNQKKLDKLEEYLDSHDNIRISVISHELMVHMWEYTDYERWGECLDPDQDSCLIYNKCRFIADPFRPSGEIKFLGTTKQFNFEVPCVCGIYSDEPHGMTLK